MDRLKTMMKMKLMWMIVNRFDFLSNDQSD